MAKIAEQASALLAQASAALADGDEDVALEALVAAWRVARHDAIAAVIARLSARLEPHVAPLGGRLPEFHAAWMAMGRSGRAVYLPRLVGSVLHSTHRFGTAVVEALLARGELLSAWPADPRLAALVVEHLRRPGYESTSRSTLPFWRVLFAILGAHGDAQTLAFLQDVRFARTFRSFSDGKRRIAWFQQHADEARAELASRLGARAPAPARSALDATVAKIDKALGARAKSAP
ncbi:MAG: hypothetical protein KC503_05430, partial [Myxococcales bacterium]|nr:hypothetical protein [Myxococcales bacterium]